MVKAEVGGQAHRPRQCAHHDELVEEFTKYGQKPGPIVDSTRGLYRRKLVQLRADETKSREYGQKPGPIVDSTRGLYRRKLVQLRADETKSREYGQKPGPIVDSTRGLYRRKLAQLRADETKSREYGQKPGPIVDSTRGLYRRKLVQLRADETKSREKGEEEEAGVIEEPASSVRLRSNTTKIQHSKEPPSRYPRSTRPCPPQSSSILSLVLGVALLLVMFAIMVLIYNRQMVTTTIHVM